MGQSGALKSGVKAAGEPVLITGHQRGGKRGGIRGKDRRNALLEGAGDRSRPGPERAAGGGCNGQIAPQAACQIDASGGVVGIFTAVERVGAPEGDRAGNPVSGKQSGIPFIGVEDGL